MRILFVSRFFPYIGGREAAVLSLAEELSKNNEVAILTPDIGRASEKYKIFRYESRSLKKHLRLFNPEIISSHTFYLTPKVIEASDKLTPITLTLHGDLLNFGSEVDKKIFLDMISELDKVITVCGYGRDQLSTKAKISQDKLITIKNGVDTDTFSPRRFERNKLRQALRLPQNKYIFVTPARMVSYKGIEFLLEAIKELTGYSDKIHFLVATPPSRQREEESEYTKKILRIAQGYNLESMFSVGFYDFVSMPLLYNASDALLLPSMTEQLPMSILEAQSSGLPVIATNVGGVSEIISNGKTGILAEYGDQVGLKEKILNIYAEKNLYKKISYQSRKNIIACHTKEKMVQGYLNLFKNLTGVTA